MATLARTTGSILIGVVLCSAALLKVDADAFTLASGPLSIFHSRAILLGFCAAEAILGSAILLQLGERRVQLLYSAILGCFACVAVFEFFEGKKSCGCFGAVAVPPLATASFDVVAAASLFFLANANPSVGWIKLRPRQFAGFMAMVIGLFICFVAIEWRGMVARQAGMSVNFAETHSDMPASQPDVGGSAGSLVILDTSGWINKPFTLLRHIDLQTALSRGSWVVLLVHHDCDDCLQSIPRYIEQENAELPTAGTTQMGTTDSSDIVRLAIIQMPPYGDLPNSGQGGNAAGHASGTDSQDIRSTMDSQVLYGKLDTQRDWFATTPVAILIKDGEVKSAAEGEQAEQPNVAWWKY